MIKGIITDVDGVILDSTLIWHNLGERFIKFHGVQPGKNINDILFSMSMEQGAEYINKNYLHNISAEEIQKGFENMIKDEYFNSIPLKKGALEYLRTANEFNIPVIAATSSPWEHIEKSFRRLGILSFFKRILTSSEVGSSKHSPEIYFKSAEILETEPDETVVIEDSLYALETAKKSGFITIGVKDLSGEPNQKKLKEISDYYAESTGNINEILKMLLS